MAGTERFVGTHRYKPDAPRAAGFLQPSDGDVNDGIADAPELGSVSPLDMVGTRRREDLDAIKALIEWADEKGLLIESLTCGDVTVKLRPERVINPQVVAPSFDDEEDDEDPEKPVLPERSPDVYADLARRHGKR